MALPMDLQAFLSLGSKQLGKPYQFGYKPLLSDKNPSHFDCSALVHWLYGQVGVNVPDGSQNQFEASAPVQSPQLGDLCFLAHPGAPTHHVGIAWEHGMVLEAHGSAVWANEPKWQVILRAQSQWEKQPDFAGWRRLKYLSK
jgi:cell wall-associated NlpC family hydrolase